MLVIPMWLEFIFHERLGVGERRHRFFYSPTTKTWWQRLARPHDNPSNRGLEEVCRTIKPPVPEINYYWDIIDAQQKLRIHLDFEKRWEEEPSMYFEAATIQQNNVHHIRYRYEGGPYNQTELPWTYTWKFSPTSQKSPRSCVLHVSNIYETQIEVEGLLRNSDYAVGWRRVTGAKLQTKDPDPTAINPLFGFTVSQWWFFHPKAKTPLSTAPTTHHFQRRVALNEVTKTGSTDDYVVLGSRFLLNPVGANNQRHPSLSCN